MTNKYVYSESFKQHVVSEIEAGKFMSFNAVRKACNIGGGKTITEWVKKYEKKHLLPRTITVTKAKEKSEIQKLRKRVMELEHAVSDSLIEVLIEREYVNILCEEFDVDRDKYKKSRFKLVGNLNTEHDIAAQKFCCFVAESINHYFQSLSKGV